MRSKFNSDHQMLLKLSRAAETAQTDIPIVFELSGPRHKHFDIDFLTHHIQACEELTISQSSKATPQFTPLYFYGVKDP